MSVQHGLEPALEALHRARGAEAEVEQHRELAGNHVGGPGAGMDVGDLPGGGWEVLVALVPTCGGQLRQGRCSQVDWVSRQLRVGDMALQPLHHEGAGKRSSTPVLDGVAQPVHAGRLADDAVVNRLAAPTKRLHDSRRPVDRCAFFVRRDQQRNRPSVRGMRGNESLRGGDECGERGLHVGRAAAIDKAVTLRGGEGIAPPPLDGARGHHVGMPREADHGRAGPAPRPQVVHLPVAQTLDLESSRGQAGSEDLLTAVVIRRNGAPCDELARQLDGCGVVLRRRLGVHSRGKFGKPGPLPGTSRDYTCRQRPVPGT